MTINPASASAGAQNVEFTVTITNKAKQTLGSANVNVPEDFTIAGEPTSTRGTISRSGNEIQLRNLSLPTNGSVTVTLRLNIPCTAGNYKWEVQAKQANDFNGAGNDMGPISGSLYTTVSGGSGTSSLRFVNQPADAETNAPIRAVPFAPTSSDVVTVEVLNACSRRDTSFNGTVELRLPNGTVIARSMATAGLVSFPGLSIGQAGQYTLVATTDGLTSPPSDRFEVFDVVEPCIAGGSCTATLTGTNTTSTVTGTGGSGTGFVLEAFRFGNPPVCAGYTPPTTDWYEFRTTVPRDKTVEARFNKDAVETIGGVSKLQICFAAPRDFTAKNGTVPFDYDGDRANGAEGFVGLLPDCKPYNKPTEPCILKRESLGGYGDYDRGGSSKGARVVFIVPLVWGGDPRWH